VGITDHRKRGQLAIISIPAGAPSNTLQTTVTAAAGSYWIINAYITPNTPGLAIMDSSWSLYVDTNSNLYGWPFGPDLTTTLLEKLVITSHMDWATSGDIRGIKSEYILIQNNDTVPHTFYFNYRAYFQPISSGSIT
jgi:hypothetical protein